MLSPLAPHLSRRLRSSGLAALLLTGVLAAAPALAQAQEFLSIKGNTVNLRAGPDTNHSVVTKLSKYDIVKPLEKRDDWAKVQTAEGQSGWMLEKLGWGW